MSSRTLQYWLARLLGSEDAPLEELPDLLRRATRDVLWAYHNPTVTTLADLPVAIVSFPLALSDEEAVLRLTALGFAPMGQRAQLTALVEVLSAYDGQTLEGLSNEGALICPVLYRGQEEGAPAISFVCKEDRWSARLTSTPLMTLSDGKPGYPAGARFLVAGRGGFQATGRPSLRTTLSHQEHHLLNWTPALKRAMHDLFTRRSVRLERCGRPMELFAFSLGLLRCTPEEFRTHICPMLGLTTPRDAAVLVELLTSRAPNEPLFDGLTMGQSRRFACPGIVPPHESNATNVVTVLEMALLPAGDRSVHVAHQRTVLLDVTEGGEWCFPPEMQILVLPNSVMHPGRSSTVPSAPSR